ncbi:MAG: hypothetical protein GY796_24475 [Chloroflexi bacterium]|nr:hypothetical protein [Chloroflexota bacterium]
MHQPKQQLAVELADDAQIAVFISRYKNWRGPETAASCAGGIGEPIG